MAPAAPHEGDSVTRSGQAAGLSRRIPCANARASAPKGMSKLLSRRREWIGVVLLEQPGFLLVPRMFAYVLLVPPARSTPRRLSTSRANIISDVARRETREGASSKKSAHEF